MLRGLTLTDANAMANELCVWLCFCLIWSLEVKKSANENDCESINDPFRASLALQFLQIFVLFEKWTVTLNFYLPTFSNILSNRFSISFSISFKYYFFIHSLLFFNHHLFFLYSFPTIIFFNEKYYIHNIFRNIFTRITSKSYVESCY